MIFGDQSTTQQYSSNPAIQVHGPGWSKVLIGDDCIEHWPDFIDLIAGFVGASVTNLAATLGYNGATVDDADAFIESTELATAGTELLVAAGSIATGTVDETYATTEAAVVNSLRARVNGLQAQEAGTVELVLTSTGANLSALTAGKLRCYFNVVEVSKLRGINNT